MRAKKDLEYISKEALFRSHPSKSVIVVFRHKTEKKPLPPLVESLKKKANAYFEKEQYTKAIILYNQAIARAPHASMLYGNRAAAFMKRKWSVVYNCPCFFLFPAYPFPPYSNLAADDI